MNTNTLFRWFRREAIFFWIGMFVIPVFWVWWTLHPRFKTWERGLAIKWSAVWITFMVVEFHQLPLFFEAAAGDFPWFCAVVSAVLWVVFLLRLAGFVGMILGFQFLGMLHVFFGPGREGELTLMFGPLVWVVNPLVLNLLLSPIRHASHHLELGLQRKVDRWLSE